MRRRRQKSRSQHSPTADLRQSVSASASALVDSLGKNRYHGQRPKDANLHEMRKLLQYEELIDALIHFMVPISQSVVATLNNSARMDHGLHGVPAGYVMAQGAVKAVTYTLTNFIIALAEVGVSLGIISEGVSAGAVLIVGVTALLSPVVFKVLSPPLEAQQESPSRV